MGGPPQVRGINFPVGAHLTMSWYHLVVFVHVLGAVIWVGGILFLGFVAVPAIRRLPDDARGNLLSTIGRRFRLIGYLALAVLFITGIIQMVTLGANLSNVLDGSFFATRFGSSLAIKLVLVVIMVSVSAVHDFVVGPASARALASGADTTNLRQAASWLARVTAVLAVLVVYYAVRMLR